MALQPKHIELLERYCMGLLTEKEQQELEAEIAINEEFRKEMEGYDLLENGFKALELDCFLDKIQEWEAKYEKNENIIPLNSKRPKTIVMLNTIKKYWAAAILLLAFLPLGYWYLNSQGTTPDSLFADNFVAEEIQPHLAWSRGGETPEEGDPFAPTAEEASEESRLKALLSSGIDAYNKKNYSSATVFFEDYIKGGEKINNAREIRFYMGVSYLAQNNTIKAKEIFKDLSQQPFSAGFQPIKQSSEWYLALTLLKEGDVQRPSGMMGVLAEKIWH